MQSAGLGAGACVCTRPPSEAGLGIAALMHPQALPRCGSLQGECWEGLRELMEGEGWGENKLVLLFILHRERRC